MLLYRYTNPFRFFVITRTLNLQSLGSQEIAVIQHSTSPFSMEDILVPGSR